MLRKTFSRRFLALALVAAAALAVAPAGMARGGRGHRGGHHVVARSVFVRPAFGFGYYRPFGFYGEPFGFYGPRAVVRDGSYGLVDFNVRPQKSDIYVDGVYIGIADDYNGYPQKAALTPGKHRIKVVSPSGQIVERQIYVMPARELNFDLKFPHR